MTKRLEPHVRQLREAIAELKYELRRMQWAIGGNLIPIIPEDVEGLLSAIEDYNEAFATYYDIEGGMSKARKRRRP